MTDKKEFFNALVTTFLFTVSSIYLLFHFRYVHWNRIIFQVVANYIGTEKQVVDEPGKSFHWAGGRKNPPPDTPRCGFDGSKCPKRGNKALNKLHE